MDHIQGLNQEVLSNIDLFEYMTIAWNGFMFHFKTLQNIKIDSISILSTSYIKPLKLFICENWEKTIKKDNWEELKPIEISVSNRKLIPKNGRVSYEIITATFTNLILPCNYNGSILILFHNIYFLSLDQVKQETLQYQNKNEHILMRDYGKGMNLFEVLSNFDYCFIGSIETSSLKKVYHNVNRLKDIFFYFQ